MFAQPVVFLPKALPPETPVPVPGAHGEEAGLCLQLLQDFGPFTLVWEWGLCVVCGYLHGKVSVSGCVCLSYQGDCVRVHRGLCVFGSPCVCLPVSVAVQTCVGCAHLCVSLHEGLCVFFSSSLESTWGRERAVE